MNFNITDIAQYIGWAFLAIFLGIGLFISIGLYLESSKDKKNQVTKKANGEETVEEKNRFKSIGKKRALIVDDKDKKKVSADTMAKNVFSKTQEKGNAVGFAPTAGSASVENIAASLSELNGANTLNPFRPPVDEEDAFLQQNTSPAQEKENSTPEPYSYGSGYTEPVPVVEPKVVTPPTIPGPPPVVSGSFNNSGFVKNDRVKQEETEKKNSPIRRPLPPPPTSLK